MEILKKPTNTQILLALSLIGFATFLNFFFNGFVGDDKEQIYNYGLVKRFFDLPKVFFYHHEVLEQHSSLLGAYYKPLMLFYFYLIRIFFGLNPFFYHTPQVLLAIVNSFLVFLLFKKFLTKDLAFILAVVFLIHPINQETVAYVSNIQDILFFFFGISGFLLIQRGKDLKSVFYATFLLLLSLLSKETGILFLAISGAYILFFKAKDYKKYFAAFLCVLAAYSSFRLASQSTSVFWIEPSPMSELSLNQRIIHLPILFFYYIKTFAYPNTLTFNQQWIIKNTTFSHFFAPLTAVIVFVSFVTLGNILLYVKHSQYFRIFLFFTIWFFAGIIPHMQLVALDATVADRWFYFSSVGILGMVGVFLQIVMYRHEKRKRVIFLCLFILCILLAGRTFVRNAEWKDAFTLYSKDAHAAKSALIENNLGNEYFKMGDYDNAKIHFNNALLINQKLWIALNNLGIIEEKKGNYSTALIYYKKAMQKDKRLPIYENIARALVLNGQQKEAIQFIIPALNTYPFSANLWLTLSLAQYDSGLLQEALGSAKKSYEIAPDPRTLNVINTINHELK